MFFPVRTYPGPGDVELTAAQQQKMERINANNEAIDEMADILSDGIAGLKDLAEAMGEELDLQAEMLQDVGKNIDKADDEIRRVNKDLRGVINSKAACCQNQCKFIYVATKKSPHSLRN